MKSILYVSVADPAIDRNAVQQIIATSRERNGRDNVSGLMLYNGTNFMQLIEGPTATIDACYDRIRRDPRHSGVTIIRENAITAREFPAWSMQYSFVDYPVDAVMTLVRETGNPTPDTLDRVGAFIGLGRAFAPSGGVAG